MNTKSKYRFLFAGGGTGGHIFPAIAVAQQIRLLQPDAQILFVGTKNKIEATAVPFNGFEFKSIWISGFQRKKTVENLLFPLKIIIGTLQSLWINIKFQPHVAIGTGAYVSGPAIWAANFIGAKIILLEQNSYPGFTNRLLEKKAEQIHIAFEDSKKYFREKEKIKLSGNPIRINLVLKNHKESIEHYNLDSTKLVLLILGGSLGARSINKAVFQNLQKLIESDIQILWQCGKLYYDEYKHLESEKVKVIPFADDMSILYSAADLILARSGATTIAEVSFLGLPVIFVPSTNVAENHQYINAKSIVDKDGAELIEDKDLNSVLIEKVNELINNSNRKEILSKNIKLFSKPDAANLIAKEAIKLSEIL
ncbi:MAG: undecaprenyldiphospho-muramoylpentapeptide beta-N-acetylglucosaminyltransferase [Melioribacteraceae bacterium]